MGKDTVIDVDSVSMVFNISKEKIDSIKEYAIKILKHQLMYTEFTALNNVSFSISRGEVVGLVGLTAPARAQCLK